MRPAYRKTVEARPEEEAPEHTHQRGYERHGDEQADDHRSCHGGAERLEEVERARESAALPAATISPAVSTVGKYSAVAFVAASTFSSPSSRRLRIAGEEEDGVVGHDPEHERHHDRLGVARHGEAELGADPRDDVLRDEVRDARRGQRDGRRERRSVIEPRITAMARIAAKVTQGSVSTISRHSWSRAGTAPVTPTNASSGSVTYFEANVCELVLVAQRQLRVHHEERDRRRPALAGAREETERVRDREGELDSGKIRVIPRETSAARSTTRSWAWADRPSGSRWTTAI